MQRVDEATPANKPGTIYLKDYTPPAYLIDKTDLDFDIHDGHTDVRCTMQIRRNPDSPGSSTAPLFLNGEDLELNALRLDNRVLEDGDYTLDDKGLTIEDVPKKFTLEVKNRITPEKNTRLMGLYKSGSIYCTQCEPQGFRRITYYPDRPDVMTCYTVRVEADKKTCPVLLSNGNLVEEGEAANDRHFTIWDDPFPKPCYLFALVGGDLEYIRDGYTTGSGRVIDLRVYVDPGNTDKAEHAMLALKNSMAWDEQAYGREYDLDLFNIVAVNDFNFGAMENKSLNIFNSRYVLAKPKTATDDDFLNIERIVAHEYFHNWSGNRVTCRDWFQLSLKEGLTVFRDQSFMEHMHSPAVKRIGDVQLLRRAQFPEDSGPMAHPVRPDNYIEINNFYTVTIYEKGAEVIRMMHNLMGPDAYRKGTDIYFERFDGQAVTCEDFVACMEEASDLDLGQFKLWYSQAGTPRIAASGEYDPAEKTYRLTLKQHIPDTPGQTGKKPMHISVATGLIGPDGNDMPLTLADEVSHLHETTTKMLHLREAEQVFEFINVPEKPVPSILRSFSAPVIMETGLSEEDLRFMMVHDSDGFNRWDAGQTYATRVILRLVKDAAAGRDLVLDEDFISAYGAIMDDVTSDRALVAKALTLPSEDYLSQMLDVVNVDHLHTAHNFVMCEIRQHLGHRLSHIYDSNHDITTYSIDEESLGRRALKNLALRYLLKDPDEESLKLAQTQYQDANNMTDRIAALAVLADTVSAERDHAFADFYENWRKDTLVLDKWFALQALADRKDTPETVKALLDHEDFVLTNPNRVRSLLGTFSSANMAAFHRADGAGYELLSEMVLKMDALNPQVASRLLTPFRQWKRFDESRRSLMQTQLERIAATRDLSPDTYEIVTKTLAA